MCKELVAKAYRRDCASTISGTDAMLALSQKSRLSYTFRETLQRIRFVQTNQNVIAELRRRAAQMPDREKERIRRIEESRGLSLKATHPPSAYRRGFLSAHRVPQPKVALSTADFERIQRELAPLQVTIQRELVGAFA